MTGNPRVEALLMVASAAAAGAGLGLAMATAAIFAAISLRWPTMDGILYFGLLSGGMLCYRTDTPQRLRPQCNLGTACVGAFACMIIVFASGNVAAQLLPHERAIADLTSDISAAPWAAVHLAPASNGRYPPGVTR
jgi:hypothetical protein